MIRVFLGTTNMNGCDRLCQWFHDNDSGGGAAALEQYGLYAKI